MANEDHMFENVMKQLGVRPLEDAEPGENEPAKKLGKTGQKKRPKSFEEIFLPEPEPNVLDEDDRNLFLEHLAKGRIVDKDSKPQGPHREALTKKRASKNESIDEVLDLHGHNVEMALNELQTFITRAFTRSLRSVVVVTGKGKHSRHGVSVLRPRVEQWIRQKGRRYIRSYAEAPRAYGGKGAFIVYIRQS